MTLQLDLFRTYSEYDEIRAEVADVKLRNENVRKGIFARHNELAKLYMDLYDRVVQLEAELKK